MRVLFCTLEYPPSPVGGAERQAQLQAEELERLGHEVHVVCQRTSGSRSGRVNGIRVHRLPRIDVRRFRTLSYLTVLAGFLLLRVRRFDLVHVHLANAQADVAVFVAHALRRPAYVKLAAGGPRGEIGRFRRVARLTRYYGIRHADVVQAISSEIAEDLSRIGVSGERIRAIPNGVRIPPLRDAEKASARQRLGIDETRVMVLNSARLEREKGGADLLAAWAARPVPRGQLVIIGANGIKEPVDVSSLPVNAEYRGWTDDVGAYLSAADIFVLPSHVEGMSNALLEAMAMGLPCVATRVGAANEMIEDGRSGLLVDAGDHVALMESIHRLVNDVALRRRLGRQARTSVTERYGIGPVVERILEAYRSIVVSS